jgi:hypothetical protein
MILKTICDLTSVSSLVLFETVRDSILIEHIVQFGGPLLTHPGRRHPEQFLDTDEGLVCTDPRKRAVHWLPTLPEQPLASPRLADPGTAGDS